MATEAFLPAATRLAIQKADGTARFYTTRGEIVLGTSNATATCPMTKQPVRVIDHSGFRVFFLPNQVNYRQVDAPNDRNLNACLLIYDIPDRAVIDNPSPQLRRLGLRVNLSCWVIPEADIPYALMHRMAEAGATWHAVRFDQSEAAKLVKMGVQSLKRELAEQVRRARRSQDRATGVLDATTESAERAEARYLRETAAIVKRYEELAADLETAAARFGIAPESFGAADAAAAIAGISVGMAERAKTYLKAQRELAERGTPVIDQVPAGIMADLLDEAGSDTAAEVRAAFVDVPGSWVYGDGDGPEPPDDDDGVFSLVNPEYPDDADKD